MKATSYIIAIFFALSASPAQAAIVPTLPQETQQKLSSSDAEKLNEAKQLGLEGKRLFQEGKVKEALPALHKSLEMKEKFLGKDHPAVATSLHNLGIICLTIDNLEQAERYFKQALKICEKNVAANHPDNPKEVSILSVLEGLSECSERKSEWAKAENYQQQALARRINILGKDHTDVGVNLLNLTAIQIEKKSFDKAQQNLQQALTIFEKLLGKTHTKYAEALECYAWLLFQMGNETEANKKLEQANEIVFANATDKTAPLEFFWRSFRCRLLKSKSKTSPQSPAGTKVASFYYVIKMKVWVDETGAVTNLQTLSRPLKATPSIEEDVKNATFRPAIINGKPVKMVGLYVRFIENPIYFSIQ